MLTSARLPVSALLAWCRALRHGLHAGLSPVRVFRQQAKSGPAAARPLAKTLADRLEQGDSLEDALAPHRGKVPLLFAELVAVGEQTGRLTETFGVLEQYFETVLAARRAFLKALTWPLFMAGSAVMVVALLILVMGLIPGGFDPIGLGTGPGRAVAFLFVAGSVAAVGGFLFFKVRDDDSARAAVEGAVLPVPALGGCVRAFALQRFSLAMEMATEAGLRVDRAIKLALRATANRAYAGNADRAAKAIRGGQEVADVLAGCGPHLFPADYIDVVVVGEESGQLAEVMKKLADQYREESVRKLKTLTMIAGGAVYAGVGLMVIVVIGRIVMAIGGIYDDAMRGL
jgi:type IV pilus assembly protein PilC